jgi:predicted AAA+ superfamily ATPase
VAFSGRRYPDHFVWGEIAAQLQKPEAFRKYWQNGPQAPDEQAWIDLIGDEPTLILLDELPPYFDNAMTRPVGGGTLAQVATAALANLFAAALKLPRLCIVVSNLSGTYETASKDLRRAMKNVEQEARRQAKPITPVDLGGDEIYQILKKRLFEKLPTSATSRTSSRRTQRRSRRPRRPSRSPRARSRSPTRSADRTRSTRRSRTSSRSSGTTRATGRRAG